MKTPKMAPPASGVKVRMYRPRGLGDCFLLAFPAAGVASGARYLLIDCGVFYRTQGGAARLRAIAADIEAATGGHLDVLVATHEHWDHLSGFQFAKETFDRMSIDQVWLAWTEEPDDPVAQRLRGHRAALLGVLHGAAARLTAAGEESATEIRRVLDFHGGGKPGAAGFSAGTARQMGYVQRLVAKPRYCRPGREPFRLTGVNRVRIYVLGPPEDEALLTRSDPSKRDSEVYEKLSLGPEIRHFAAALGFDPGGGSDAGADSTPFDGAYSRPLAGAGEDPLYGGFFTRRYGFDPGSKHHGEAWRRIDHDWLGSASDLALQLDSDTNNTSLALAIELADGRVLLFPGDAQVGNWLSWQGLRWARSGGARGTGGGEVTGADLLRRTVLYKVGHHGSHNATLRQQGLELMESDELVAMIPVDEKQAKAKRWKMPFEPLYARLAEKTRGRILRADVGAPATRPGALPVAEWQDFTDRLAEDPGSEKLWVEITIPDRPSSP